VDGKAAIYEELRGATKQSSRSGEDLKWTNFTGTESSSLISNWHGHWGEGGT